MTEEQVYNLIMAVGSGVIMGGVAILIVARLLLGKGWFGCFVSDLRKAIRGPK